MAWDSEFEDMMPQVVIHELVADYNEYNERTFGAPTNLKARIEYSPHMVRTATGEERIAAGLLFVKGGSGVQPTSRITLPDGTKPLILAVDKEDDESGAHHEAIHFGAA